jgi:BirA family biotin operon repressor/biotin-[acetyl-CoA-carboxylase] ligase
LYKILANTLFIGKNIVFVPECHSTNSLALELCQQGSAQEGVVVITNQQTAGRGQRGNTWESQPGKNLTFSIVLKPSFLPVKNQFLMNMFSSLAIHDYLSEKSTVPVHIKWPNDILVDGFKICGILIENQMQGEKFTYSVLGIGLNVNQQQFTAGKPTSLSLITQTNYDLQAELEILLTKVEARYVQLRQNKHQRLRDDYLKALYKLNQPHTFFSTSERFEGKITGVDEDGRLRILAGSHERTFDLKEISFG